MSNNKGYLVSLYKNMLTYNKHNKVFKNNWVHMQLPILGELYLRYPQPVKRQYFIDSDYPQSQLDRAIVDLKRLNFVLIETLAPEPGKKGNHNKCLHLTDAGIEFMDYIKPE